ncbi:MAG: type II secretion system F family protein [Alphaproteobacteria bacterium]
MRFPDLPLGLAVEDAVALLAGLAAVIAVTAVWRAATERQPATGRARALSARKDALLGAMQTPRRRRGLRMESVSLVQQAVRFLRLQTGRQADQARAKLAQAGHRSRDALGLFLFAKVSLPLVAGLAAIVVFYAPQLIVLSDMGALAAAIGAVLAGAYGPDVFIRNMATKRRQAIQLTLPDALDLLVICTEAGLGLDAALARVARELNEASPELADELALAGIELGFMPERRMALDALAARVPLPGVRGLVTTLIQTERYGTPLAQALRVLAREMRDERLMKAEEKAARLPAVLTVPMVSFILPALFIVLIGPAVLRVIDTLGSM